MTMGTLASHLSEKQDGLACFDSEDETQNRGFIGVLQFVNRSALWSKKEYFSNTDKDAGGHFSKCLAGYMYAACMREVEFKKFAERLEEYDVLKQIEVRRKHRLEMIAKLKKRKEEEEAFKKHYISELCTASLKDKSMKWQSMVWRLSLGEEQSVILMNSVLNMKEIEDLGIINVASMMGNQNELVPTDESHRKDEEEGGRWENMGGFWVKVAGEELDAYEDEIKQNDFQEQLDMMGGEDAWAALMGGNAYAGNVDYQNKFSSGLTGSLLSDEDASDFVDSEAMYTQEDGYYSQGTVYYTDEDYTEEGTDEPRTRDSEQGPQPLGKQRRGFTPAPVLPTMSLDPSTLEIGSTLIDDDDDKVFAKLSKENPAPVKQQSHWEKVQKKLKKKKKVRKVETISDAWASVL